MLFICKWGDKMQGNRENPYNNSEGYSNPTAYYATKNVMQEQEREKKLNLLVKIIKDISDLAGFEIVGRITFKHKKSGNTYK